MTTTRNNTALFMADAHIKSRTWTNNMQLYADAYTALLKLTKHVQTMKNPPKTLLIAGDWFDSNKPTSTDLMKSIDFLSLFEQVIYITGNHDTIEPSFLQVAQYMQDTVVTQIGCSYITTPEGIHIAGIQWTQNSKVLEERLQEIHESVPAGEPMYLLMHQAFKHLLNFEGSYSIAADVIERIFAGRVVRVLVGDIHTRHTLELEGGGYIHSPGSLYPTSFDKTSEPYAASLIDLDTGAIEDIDCKVREYYTYEYKNETELKELVTVASEERRADFLQPFIRVTVPKDSEVKILQSQHPGVVVQTTSVDEQTTTNTPELNRQNLYTLQEAITAEAGEGILSELAVALLNTDDPLQEIENWLNYWEVERIG